MSKTASLYIWLTTSFFGDHCPHGLPQSDIYSETEEFNETYSLRSVGNLEKSETCISLVLGTIVGLGFFLQVPLCFFLNYGQSVCLRGLSYLSIIAYFLYLLVVVTLHCPRAMQRCSILRQMLPVVWSVCFGHSRELNHSRWTHTCPRNQEVHISHGRGNFEAIVLNWKV